MTEIEVSAFYEDKHLSDIIVDADTSAYRSINGVLFNRNQTELCVYPMGKKETSYSIPSGVTSIGSYAFRDNTTLTSVGLPAGVVHIEENAFTHCECLTGINLPSGVTHIGEKAFLSCSALISVNIPSGVKSIGVNAFANTALPCHQPPNRDCFPNEMCILRLAI